MKARGIALSLGVLLFGATLAFAQIVPSSHFATLDETRVHYTNFGAGEKALLLVHGWSSDEAVWKKQAPALAKSIRVITVDLPGHGKATSRNASIRWTIMRRLSRRCCGMRE